MKGRINIDLSLFSEEEMMQLILICGCQFKAQGMWLSVARLAQKYWVKHQCIPDEFWNPIFSPMIDCGFVRKVDGGYYLRGSSEYFDWLRKQSEAGKKGAEKRWGSHGVPIGSDGDTITSMATNTNTNTNSETSSDLTKTKVLHTSQDACAVEIISKWNSLGLREMKLTPMAIREISRIIVELNHYPDALNRAISNYHSVITANSTWFEHRYTLKNFLISKKTIIKFTDEFELRDYLRSEGSNNLNSNGLHNKETFEEFSARQKKRDAMLRGENGD